MSNIQAGYAREERKRRAAERQAKVGLLTPQERLKRLDRKFGPGVGAIRERARLLATVEKAKS